MPIVKIWQNERSREGEMHVYKQKLRFLMTEQSRRVAEVRLHNLQQMKSFQESTSSIQNSMRQTIERKNQEISKGQTSIYTMMRQLQLENAEHASKLRSDFCAELRRIDSTFVRMMYEREKAQEIQEAAEIQRTQQEKSEHISQLMNLHQTQLKDMKDYFNEITANNFAVISALQEELARLREKEQELTLEVTKGRKEVRKLEETVLKGKEEAEQRLRDDRKSAQEIKRQLDLCTKRLKYNDKYAHGLEISNEALFQKVELVQRERDVLKGSFTKSIVDMQKKSNMHKLILEMKLNSMSKLRNYRKTSTGDQEKLKRNLQFQSSLRGSISSEGDSSRGSAAEEPYVSDNDDQDDDGNLRSGVDSGGTSAQD